MVDTRSTVIAKRHVRTQQGPRQKIDLPDNLEQAEFETIAAFRPDTEVRKDEEPCVFVGVLRILEVVQRRHNRSRRALCLSILSGDATSAQARITTNESS